MNANLNNLLSTRLWTVWNRVPSTDRVVNSIRDDLKVFAAHSAGELRRRLPEIQSESKVFSTKSTSVDNLRISYSTVAIASIALERATGLRLYDEQLLGAFWVARRAIVEMKTGEGKSAVAVAAAIACCLQGRQVHMATTNAYLAERDAKLFANAFSELGLTVGLVAETADESANRAAYQSDVVFGPGYQFGFDYLRDQLQLRRAAAMGLGHETLERLVGGEPAKRLLQQRGRQVVIIDEADSVLIDEAATPLILSGGEAETDEAQVREAFQKAHQVAASLVPDRDFQLDRQRESLTMTGTGLEVVSQALANSGHLRLVRPWKKYVENAVRAIHCLRLDEHYVINDQEIQIVDQQTGRIFADRSWQDGLHEAVAIKEELEPPEHGLTQARITRQRYFQKYDALSGLTGTATALAREFEAVFGAQVKVIPTHQPNQRHVLNPRFFDSVSNKLSAIARMAVERSKRGQPVLIGTRTIADSRRVAFTIQELGRMPVVLNGCQDDCEAEIVARAGIAGQVTIATNMAGRGTDIKLDPAARENGGLHVIASEPNDSRRVDEQLFGRCARQGDPGSAQLFVSAEDELLTRFSPATSQRLRQIKVPHGESNDRLEREIRLAQHNSERQQLLRRQLLMKQDLSLDKVRQAIFG